MYFDGYNHPHLKRVGLLSLILLCQGTLLDLSADVITHSSQPFQGFKAYEIVETVSYFVPIFAPMLAPIIIRQKSLGFTLWFSNIGYVLYNLFGVIIGYCAENSNHCDKTVLTVAAILLTIFSNFSEVLLFIAILVYAMKTSPTEERGNFLGVIIGIEALSYMLNGALIYLLRSIKDHMSILAIVTTIFSILNTVILYRFPEPQKVENKKAIQDISEHYSSFGAILTIFKKLLKMRNFQKLFLLMGFTGALGAIYQARFEPQLYSEELILGTQPTGYLFILGAFSAFGAFLNGYLVDLNSKIVSFKIGLTVFSVGIAIAIFQCFNKIDFVSYIELAVWGFSDTSGELILLAFIAHEFSGKLEGVCFSLILHESLYFIFMLITKYWNDFLPILIILWLFGLATLISVARFDLMVIFEDEYFKTQRVAEGQDSQEIFGRYLKMNTNSLNTESDIIVTTEKPLLDESVSVV